jgi:hypothetical protein
VVLVSIESLFFEGITIHVIAVLFPKAGDVVIQEFKATHPLHGLPPVEVRHDQPQRIAVIGREWFAVMMRGEKHVVAVEIGQRNVGGVFCSA